MFFVNTFRKNDPHPGAIEREVKQLQEIESALSNEFFKDVKKRFRRSSKRHSVVTGRRFVPNENKSAPHLYPASTRKLKSRRTSEGFYENQPVELENSNEFGKDEVDAPGSNRHETILDSKSGELNILKIRKSEQLNSEEFDDIHTYTHDEETELYFGQVTFSDSAQGFHSERTDTVKSLQLVNATALDFELNVVVDIESGKCTFHAESNDTKDTTLTK